MEAFLLQSGCLTVVVFCANRVDEVERIKSKTTKLIKFLLYSLNIESSLKWTRNIRTH
jgi:hypothetical protein